MLRLFITTLLVGPFISASSEIAPNITPCKISDSACIDNVGQMLYTVAVQGNPELDMEILDPMYQKNIDGKLSIINYTLTNSTLVGFKMCKVTNTKILLDKLNIQLTLNCPEFSMSGLYVVDGMVLVLPIQGSGDYTIDIKKYIIKIDSAIELTPGENGNKYMTLKNVKFNAEVLGGLTCDLRNLFNGRKDLAEPVLKFMNENWKEVGTELQGPILSANIKKLVKNFNKYLKTIPVAKLITI